MGHGARGVERVPQALAGGGVRRVDDVERRRFGVGDAGDPVGTAYAVWVGVGAVLTVLVAVMRGEEKLGVAKAVLLAALIGCVAGLKVVS